MPPHETLHLCLFGAIYSAIPKCNKPCASLTASLLVTSYITLLSVTVYFQGVSIIWATNTTACPQSSLAYTSPCTSSQLPPASALLCSAADLQTLAKLIPAQSRMVLNPATLEDPAQADKAADVDLAMVPTANIRPGDVVRVLPGERMPVDGDIIEGKCSVDESMLTGESVPVAKAKGQQVGPCKIIDHNQIAAQLISPCLRKPSACWMYCEPSVGLPSDCLSML